MRWESEKQGCNHCGRPKKSNKQENIAKAAANYLKIMPMSRDELVNQLTSEAGDQYTLEEAQYGVEKAYK